MRAMALKGLRGECMKKTKIEWCDMTWNPVTGCLHGCKYCYARRIAERFGLDFAPKLGDPGMEGAKKYDSEAGIDTMLELEKPFKKNGRIQPYPFGFQPTLHKYHLDQPAKVKTGKLIFVGSMTDLFGEWVPDEWIREVFEACDRAPWHTYMFLTKNPNRYIELAKKDLLPRQHWYGYSATRQDQLWHFHHAADCPCINLFVSIEPILEFMVTPFSTHLPAGWVIMGAETGSRKNKVVPEKRWIQEIAETCEWCGIPVFMKESLQPIMGEEGMKRQFPLKMTVRKFQEVAYKSGVTTEQAFESLAKASERREENA